MSAQGDTLYRVPASPAGRMTIAASLAGAVIGTVDFDVGQRTAVQSP
ncbi:MAG: hypothetical protein P3B98_09090 [Gemmatimonadota bacterium]|nr:hypothetical protein [Gemmatimonadota bacterium]